MINAKARIEMQNHPFHLVSPSLWPVYTSTSLWVLVSTGVLCMHSFSYSPLLFFFAFFNLLLSMSYWFRDVVGESTYLGNHTFAVQRGITIGVGLFIVSEALFFLAIFWSYFHNSVSPVIELGAKWPPLGIESINPYELPLLNTMLLLSSGVSVTYCHHSLIQGDRTGALYGGIVTIALAFIFTVFQGLEYTVSSFTLADSIYGSTFYFGTGFHGLHVMIGTAFIAVGIWRIYVYHSTDNHHLGVEASILYWHFVDVVWLFLFISFYYLGC